MDLNLEVMMIEDQTEKDNSNAGPLVARNHLILENVFCLLKISDIKRCRLVNSLWMDISQPWFNDLTILKIYYGKKEPNKTAREFLSEFNRSPIDFLFASLSINFGAEYDWKNRIGDEEVISFDWEHDPMLELLRKCGNGLKYLKLKVVSGLAMENLFLSLKAILSQLVPELEVLCLEIELKFKECYLCPPDQRNLYDLEELQRSASPDIKLRNLKKLEWSITPGRKYLINFWPRRWPRWFDVPYEEFYSSVIRDLMNNAPNLMSVVAVGSQLTSLAFNLDNDDLNQKGINETAILGLKNIQIYYESNAAELFCAVFPKLMELGQNNLRLTTFTVEYRSSNNQDEDEIIWEAVTFGQRYFFTSLYTFLASQTECLENLVLWGVGADAEQISLLFEGGPLPPFPTLTGIKNLKMSDGWTLEILIPGGFPRSTRLKHFFPNLETFVTNYEYECCGEFMDLPKYLENCVSDYSTLKSFSVTLRLDIYISDNEEENEQPPIPDLTKIVPTFYELAKGNCPKLNTIHLRDTTNGVLYSWDHLKLAGTTEIPKARFHDSESDRDIDSGSDSDV